MLLRYRVVSKRAGSRPKVVGYSTLAAAQRRVALLTSPEPWVALGHRADDRVCCNGWDCGCGGKTYADDTARLRDEMPDLEWVRIDERDVSPWRPLAAESSGPASGGA